MKNKTFSNALLIVKWIRKKMQFPSTRMVETIEMKKFHEFYWERSEYTNSLQVLIFGNKPNKFLIFDDVKN